MPRIKFKYYIQEPLGSLLKAAEETEINETAAQFLGQWLVSFGNHLVLQPDLSRNFPNQLSIDNESFLAPSPNTVVAALDEIPLSTDSMDLLIASHIVEFMEQPAAIIQEMWRVLTPEGHCIVTGFNNHSLFGVPNLYVAKQGKHKQQPLLTTGKIRRLFIAQGFEIIAYKTFFFRPLLRNLQQFPRLQLFDTIGKYCWPYLGTIYLYLLRKPVLSLTQLRFEPNTLVAIEPTVLPQASATKIIAKSCASIT